jgi:hypothetical protein
MKYCGNRKGVTSVIGTLFFLAILVLSLASLLYIITQIGIYNLSVIEMSRFDWERMQEKLVVKTLWINISAPYSRVNITIENQGTIPLEVDQLWIINRTDNIHKMFQLNPAIYLKPQEGKTGVGIDYTIDTGKNYTFMLVTRRGNKAYIDYTLKEYIRKEILPYIHFSIFSPDYTPPDRIISGQAPFHIYVTQRSNLEGITAIITKAAVKFYDTTTGRDITAAFNLQDSTLNYGYVVLREGYGTPISFVYLFNKEVMMKDFPEIWKRRAIWVDVNVTLTIEFSKIAVVQVSEYSARTLIVGGEEFKGMYVYEITFIEEKEKDKEDKGRPETYLYANVKIVDLDGKGVDNAKVTIEVTLPDGTVEKMIGLTNKKGVAEFKLGKEEGLYCVEVIDVEKEGWQHIDGRHIDGRHTEDEA